MSLLVKILLVYLMIMTIITFLIYSKDKTLAIKQKKKRISEVVLLTLSILGGALGGYLAMIIRHHKTKHWYFTLTNILGIVFYTLLIYLLIK